MNDEAAKQLFPPHPWHHPMYMDLPGVADSTAFSSIPLAKRKASAVVFISATRADAADELDAAYWRRWLTAPVNFAGALQHFVAANPHLTSSQLCLVETGPHNVLTTVAKQTLYCLGVVGDGGRREGWGEGGGL